MSDKKLPLAVVHLDESCLGNGRTGNNPGGAGGLVEVLVNDVIERRDLFLHAPATTNNRMALAGAIAMMQLLARKQRRMRVLVVSDSQYLVLGVREWAPEWQRRGWKRKGGAIENLELWQALWRSLELHDVQFGWVRGHIGLAKNEYADHLAKLAATEQRTSEGLVESGFAQWLVDRQMRGSYENYDPDADFDRLAERLASGKRFDVEI